MRHLRQAAEERIIVAPALSQMDDLPVIVVQFGHTLLDSGRLVSQLLRLGLGAPKLRLKRLFAIAKIAHLLESRSVRLSKLHHRIKGLNVLLDGPSRTLKLAQAIARSIDFKRSLK